MAIKIDLAKSYDMVRWDFVRDMLFNIQIHLFFLVDVVMHKLVTAQCRLFGMGSLLGISPHSRCPSRKPIFPLFIHVVFGMVGAYHFGSANKRI